MKLLLPDGGVLVIPDTDQPLDVAGFTKAGAIQLPDEAEFIPMSGGPGDLRTIFQRLVDVKAEMPGIPKADENAEQQFKFRGIERILAAASPLLAKHGVNTMPVVRKVERWITLRGQYKNEWHHYRVDAEYRFVGLLGDELVARVPGEGLDSGDKGLSKAMTMAYKTALLQVLNIADPDQPDPDLHTLEGDDAGPASAQTRTAARKATGTAKKAGPRKQAAARNEPTPAAPAKPWDEALAEAHGDEHAAQVILLVERMAGIEDEARRQRIKDEFRADIGHPGNIGPDQLSRATEWVDHALGAGQDPEPPGEADSGSQAPIPAEQEEPYTPDPAVCQAPECQEPAKEDTPGWCADHGPF